MSESDSEFYRNENREDFIEYVNVDGFRGERLNAIIPADEFAILSADEIYIEGTDGNILGIYVPERIGQVGESYAIFFVIDMDKNIARRSQHPGADIIAEPIRSEDEVAQARVGSNYAIGKSNIFGVKEIIAIKVASTKIEDKTGLTASPDESFSDIRHRFRGMLGMQPKTAAEELGR